MTHSEAIALLCHVRDALSLTHNLRLYRHEATGDDETGPLLDLTWEHGAMARAIAALEPKAEGSREACEPLQVRSLGAPFAPAPASPRPSPASAAL